MGNPVVPLSELVGFGTRLDDHGDENTDRTQLGSRTLKRSPHSGSVFSGWGKGMVHSLYVHRSSCAPHDPCATTGGTPFLLNVNTKVLNLAEIFGPVWRS